MSHLKCSPEYHDFTPFSRMWMKHLQDKQDQIRILNWGDSSQSYKLKVPNAAKRNMFWLLPQRLWRVHTLNPSRGALVSCPQKQETSHPPHLLTPDTTWLLWDKTERIDYNVDYPSKVVIFRPLLSWFAHPVTAVKDSSMRFPPSDHGGIKWLERCLRGRRPTNQRSSSVPFITESLWRLNEIVWTRGCKLEIGSLCFTS